MWQDIRYSLFAIRFSLFALRYSLFAFRYSLFADRFYLAEVGVTKVGPNRSLGPKGKIET